jgi:hypothetical protein
MASASVTPGRGDPHHSADDRGDEQRGQQHEDQAVVGERVVVEDQRSRIGADEHERAVPDRHLAGQAGQHGQAGDRAGVVADLGEL